MTPYGHARLTAVSMKTEVGNPHANAGEIARLYVKIRDEEHSDVIVFPELCLTGYTCADLFAQQTLFDAANAQLIRLAREVKNELVFVGLPVAIDNSLFNCAAVLNRGNIIGVVPKQFIPNYKEFYNDELGRPFDAEEEEFQEEELQCENCDKIYKTEKGLQNHLEKCID